MDRGLVYASERNVTLRWGGCRTRKKYHNVHTLRKPEQEGSLYLDSKLAPRSWRMKMSQ
jgi:hypothetical protein